MSIYFIVDLTAHDGQVESFQKIATEMIAHTRNESGALAYEWFFSSDRKRCRLLETYKDGNAVSEHINGSAVKLIPKLIEHAKIDAFEVYGDPGPDSSAKLASIGAEIFSFWKGLGR
jgi:quinol monooxygenase YgiN